MRLRRKSAPQTVASVGLEARLAAIAREDAIEWVYSVSGPRTRIFPTQDALRIFAIEAAPKEGLLLEFGVYRGKSARVFSQALDVRGDSRGIYGFDSWTGFSEEWTGVEGSYPIDVFSTDGEVPSLPTRMVPIQGFIESVVPQFFAELPPETSVAFAHIDTDTYSPAFVALNAMRPYLVPGSLILFDELCGYPNWRSHEFLALKSTIGVESVEWLGFATRDEAGGRFIKALCRYSGK